MRELQVLWFDFLRCFIGFLQKIHRPQTSIENGEGSGDIVPEITMAGWELLTYEQVGQV